MFHSAWHGVKLGRCTPDVRRADRPLFVMYGSPFFVHIIIRCNTRVVEAAQVVIGDIRVAARDVGLALTAGTVRVRVCEKRQRRNECEQNESTAVRDRRSVCAFALEMFNTAPEDTRNLV